MKSSRRTLQISSLAVTVAALAVLTASCTSDSEPVAVATEVSPTEATLAPTTTIPPSETTAPKPRNETANMREPKADECPKADGSSPQKRKFNGEQPRCIDLKKKYKVVMETTKGTMTFELDPTNAPRTVNNFVTLAGFKYFDGITYHRVVRDFVIQGGDPDGNGTGGPGYAFADELPQVGEYKIGSLAMANSGPNTNGSQFFIITGANGAALPPSYSLFGQMTSGEDVMKAINLLGPEGADGPPTEEVKMVKVTASAI